MFIMELTYKVPREEIDQFLTAHTDFPDKYLIYIYRNADYVRKEPATF